MILVIRFFLRFIIIVCLIIAILFAVLGLYEHIMGPEETKKLLKKLKIPWSYSLILLVGFISLIILIILYIVSTKLY